METLKAEYKNGFWYIDGKPRVFPTMAYDTGSLSSGWHYILLHNGTLMQAIPCTMTKN